MKLFQADQGSGAGVTENEKGKWSFVGGRERLGPEESVRRSFDERVMRRE
jgi:hypothetical protein